MNPNSSRFFDDMSRLFGDAAGVAKSFGKDAELALKAQLERVLATMDVVSREEFEAVRDMAIAARNANEELERRLIALEEKISAKGE